MNKNRILCAAVLAGASLAAAAQSDAAPDTRWHAGLQLGSVHEERGLALHGYSRERGGLMVSGAAMYRVSRRWSLGLELSSFTAAHTFNAGVKGEIHF